MGTHEWEEKGFVLYGGLILLKTIPGRAEEQVKSQMARRRVGKKFGSQKEFASSVALAKVLVISTV